MLLNEAIEGLNVQKGKRYIDATAGEGGHVFEIARRGGMVLGIEWDDLQIKNLKLALSKVEGLKLESYKSVLIVQGNFAKIEKVAKEQDFFPVDGILFDLGLSQNQLLSGKGFSYRSLDDPLDMRIGSELTENAAGLINSLDSQSLYEIFVRNAEEINARTIVEAIVRARSKKKFEKVKDLVEVIDKMVGKKDKRTHARIFQALRIEVNDEFNNLRRGLVGAVNVLKQRAGRLVVIAFHSLEDRIVKRFAKENGLKLLKKVVGRAEATFRFERSAILRVMEK
ncbi:16S rRNA (cytosine(1402)-N(4))-methyltransferase RsmH [Candidatus Roizmanbacteria bacterium]|nr:16S rRNA (cytosine(1402)-N(4))-methyltransferase RsmH [Candidatus Roizmanbacteria bacterium]